MQDEKFSTYEQGFWQLASGLTMPAVNSQSLKSRKYKPPNPNGPAYGPRRPSRPQALAEEENMESDWKKFSAMVPKLREQYLSERNAKIVRMLSDPKRNETERFWDAIEVMEKEAKTLRLCLDGHSRSKMEMFMFTMIQSGMLKKEDLAVFSRELQAQVSFAFEKKRG